MARLFALVLVLLLPFTVAFGADCSLPHYEALVAAGKSAADGREWQRSVEIYNSILDDCGSMLAATDLAKAYDALAFGQLMQENYSAAIDSANKCLEAVATYNACMMTAAKGYEGSGDAALARQYAEAAVAAGVHDDYSAAVVIYAKDFLKKYEKR